MGRSTFGDLLHQARIAAGLTQCQVNEALGLSPRSSYVCQVELGDASVPGVAMVRKMAAVVGLDVAVAINAAKSDVRRRAVERWLMADDEHRPVGGRHG